MWDLRKLDANNPEKSVKYARTKDVKAHKVGHDGQFKRVLHVCVRA